MYLFIMGKGKIRAVGRAVRSKSWPCVGLLMLPLIWQQACAPILQWSLSERGYGFLPIKILWNYWRLDCVKIQRKIFIKIKKNEWMHERERRRKMVFLSPTILHSLILLVFLFLLAYPFYCCHFQIESYAQTFLYFLFFFLATTMFFLFIKM